MWCVRFSDDQQDIGVAGSATAHMLDRCFHINDGELLSLLDEVTQHTTHGGMC